ncbi:type II secretion system protein GspM [Shimia biformata]|uniref:type II secretion system protein GspM n=1 Tax=Shimia biformata TaxID=1294299 RepID=UPI0019529D6D|nr:type II secretion system protein GspM [Shimia biformata]
MTSRLIEMLLRLAPRERLLLAALVLVVLPLALALAWIEPLAARHAAAETARSEALALRQWVAGRAADHATRAPATASHPKMPPIGLGGVEESLVAAGLRDAVADLGAGADGGIELRFAAVEFTALMRWLSEADPRWGYEIIDFRIEASDTEGLVEALFRLEPQGS